MNLEPIKTTLKQPRVKWGALALILLVPLLWLGFTQPWQHQPRLPTGPLPAPQAPAASTLPPDIQALKDEGMRLWGINTADAMNAAVPLLEQVGEYGDGEALYFLGELERRNSMGHFSKAAINRYLQAAEAGDVYAMLRLHQSRACSLGGYCPEDAEAWNVKAYHQVLPQAQTGDPDAMLDLYTAGASVRWLKTAAEADNPEAQLELGMLIADGRYPGWPYYRYWSEEARLKAALPWYRRAAELGYVPAMFQYSESLYKLEAFDEAWYWTEMAAIHGHIEANRILASCYIDPDYSRTIECSFEQNVIKGLAILMMLQRAMGTDYTSFAFERHAKILATLDDQNLKEAELFAERWQIELKAPLSRYPSRFGL